MRAGCDRQCLRFVAMIGVAAILIYVSMIRWGLPHATAPDRVQTFAVDELLPLSALAEMHNTFVVSKPDRSYGYPWWHYFVLAAWQTPYVVYLKLTHQMETPTTVFPFRLKDPVGNLEGPTLYGRFLSVLMGAGIVIAAYFFARTLWNHQTGTLAACLTMISYPQVYYSRLGNVDVALVLWSGKIGQVRGRQTRRVHGKSNFLFLRAARGYSRVLAEGFYLRLTRQRGSGNARSPRP